MDKREHARKLPPLASSEDLSEDLLDSPEAEIKNKCLEGIEEVPNTPAKSPRQQTLCLAMPNTPRIDISRASSSSHHDDSSPERDLFVGESKRYMINPDVVQQCVRFSLFLAKSIFIDLLQYFYLYQNV